ncbi:hypothetical protein COB64_01810 [Candidatus Wolfebacteria bacterium]|nr:MAG: hypothetical protein COB64_01810 [Candidatus Wolfebacteria bacterium]
MQYDLIIIGGGPAGSAAAVYAARKQLKALLIAYEFGGQSIVSDDIQNWIGTVSISGKELAKNLKAHVEAYADDILTIQQGENVTSIEKDPSSEVEGEGFIVKTDSDSTFSTKTVLISSGSGRRKLDVKGAEEFENKGITYCATCDGPLFSGQDVIVIGGGNAGMESAAQLLAYTKSVTLLHRGDEYRADKITVDKVLSNPKMTGILNAQTIEVKGDSFAKSLVYKDTNTGEEHELQATGVFVEIGQIPNTSFIGDVAELDNYKRIKIDTRNQKTSQPGIWSAGDCSDVLYHQNNIAAGDAVRAIEDIFVTLHTK